MYPQPYRARAAALLRHERLDGRSTLRAVALGAVALGASVLGAYVAGKATGRKAQAADGRRAAIADDQAAVASARPDLALVRVSMVVVRRYTAPSP